MKTLTQNFKIKFLIFTLYGHGSHIGHVTLTGDQT